MSTAVSRVKRAIVKPVLLLCGIMAATSQTWAENAVQLNEQAADGAREGSGMTLFITLSVLALLFVVGSATAMNYLDRWARIKKDEKQDEET